MVKEKNSLSNAGKPLKGLVISHIRDKIFKNRILCCGDQVSERELSRILGISRAPIREALKELEEQGLIVSVKYRGWFVADFREQEFFEINKLRTLLEHSLFESIIALGGPSDEELDRAEALNKELRMIMESSLQGDEKGFEFAEKEMAFHMHLHSLAKDDCYWTKKMLRNLSYQIGCSFHRWLYKEWQMKASVESHERLIQCLRKKDVDNLYELLFQRLGKEPIVTPEN